MGTATAYAYGYPRYEPAWGHVQHGGELASDADVFFELACFLREKIAEYRPRWLVTEALWLPTSKGIAAPRRTFGLDAIAKLVARQHRLRIQEYAVQEVARFFIGSGGLKSNEKKRRTKAACEQIYGWKPVTLDEADAIALWVFAEAKLDPLSRRAAGPLFPAV